MSYRGRIFTSQRTQPTTLKHRWKSCSDVQGRTHSQCQSVRTFVCQRRYITETQQYSCHHGAKYTKNVFFSAGAVPQEPGEGPYSTLPNLYSWFLGGREGEKEMKW